MPFATSRPQVPVTKSLPHFHFYLGMQEFFPPDVEIFPSRCNFSCVGREFSFIFLFVNIFNRRAPIFCPYSLTFFFLPLLSLPTLSSAVTTNVALPSFTYGILTARS